ncbi:MAG: hypothetical protein D6719_07355 [Candidatus Dadabacteria bacterium]|nr:MAG: hypothetical protein D6719_07355 [Candidatus Dadabacteria bacterium]
MDIVKLDQLFTDLVQAPPLESNQCVRFNPLTDLSWGDLYSDCCIRIAASKRISTRDVFCLLSDLSVELPVCDLRLDRGLLNIRLPEKITSLLWISRPLIYQQEQTRQYSIFIAPPSSTVSAWGALRLASLGLVQAAVLLQLGITARIWIGADLYTPNKLCHIIDIFRELLNSPVQSGYSNADLEEVIKGLVQAGKGEYVHLWMFSNSLPTATFQSIYKEYIQVNELVRFNCPGENWLKGFDPVIKFESFIEKDVSELKSLLVYLCSPSPAAELDFAVPFQKEAANLIWFVRSLIERLNRVTEGGAGKDAGLDRIPAEDLMLVRRYRYLPRIFALAGLGGEIHQFIRAYTDCLCRSARFLNNPDFRIRFEKIKHFEYESNIATGVRNAISHMLGPDSLFV